MRHRLSAILGVLGAFVLLFLLHYPLLRLPYFWDEAGYFIPAALDFSREWLLIPKSTLPSGHTPLVIMYLGLAWRFFGFSPLVTRTAMILAASATVVSLYALGRRVVQSPAGREIAAWSAVLLAVCPLFFAQSSLAHLDLAAGFFTTLAVLTLLRDRIGMFALTASLATLTKETAVIVLPVAWLFAWRRKGARQAVPLRDWLWLLAPLLPLFIWVLYYHHATDYWIGNREYLEYNIYSTLNPFRFLWTVPRRLYEVSIGGFNWLLVLGALCGYWWGRKHEPNSGRGNPLRLPDTAGAEACPYEVGAATLRDFCFLAGTLCASYVAMLSLVGGAVLPRYLLPIFPVFNLAGVMLVWRLPRTVARAIGVAVAACFVGSWFINPPWPFPFEDNLAYADFIRLHQQAAEFLETRAPEARVLTAWPASDELARPILGYVRKPLRTLPLRGFTLEDFASVPPESFDLLYLYSHKWRPTENWLTRSARFKEFQERHLDVAPPIPEEALVARYGLKLMTSFERKGQWVRIYSKTAPSPLAPLP